MKASFLNYDKPLMTVMIKQTQNDVNCISEIKRALYSKAEAFGIQMESLPRKFHTPEIMQKFLNPVKISRYM